MGKSSLINMLRDNQKLAKTLVLPVKRNSLIILSLRAPLPVVKALINGTWSICRVMVLPKFRKVSADSGSRWLKPSAQTENLINVFCIADGRHEPQEIDLECRSTGSLNIPFCLVLTKADKESYRSRKERTFFPDIMRKTWQFLPRHFVTKAVKNWAEIKCCSSLKKRMQRWKIILKTW